ncbi:peroxide stress protein YaaA [Flavobacteriaceae bacterium 14752]|uniref:peroxide stress protein YaaA n=1 Tax=Mesohalobacter salilacus TaxID=2491711 RepID=UPI000F63CB79|nr:peroxide stress protein YaaA [Flavobacteriaceae bacterium 14752]
MKILLSPAKSLNLEQDLPTKNYTTPQFLDQTEKLHKVLKSSSKNDLKDLMSISDKLAELNYSRFQDFSIDHQPQNSRPAIYTFDGDVYDGIDAYELSEEDINRLQDRLRILSGFYGLLKPLDLMQPYRLEMGTSLEVKNSKNLYEFWKDTLTKTLNNELQDEELVVNLASKEYSKSIQKSKLKGQWIEPVFKDYKNGKLKVISFYAKKARGLMTKYLAQIENPAYDDILKFNEDEYAFSKSDTKNEKQPVFVR